jgi:hypothetical protein
MKNMIALSLLFMASSSYGGQRYAGPMKVTTSLMGEKTREGSDPSEYHLTRKGDKLHVAIKNQGNDVKVTGTIVNELPTKTGGKELHVDFRDSQKQETVNFAKRLVKEAISEGLGSKNTIRGKVMGKILKVLPTKLFPGIEIGNVTNSAIYTIEGKNLRVSAKGGFDALGTRFFDQSTEFEGTEQ